MPQHTELAGRRVSIDISPAAEAELARRQQPLTVEMELYFSCLIRKKVRFHETQTGSDELSACPTRALCIRFRPVMTRSCGRDYEGDEPPLTDFPIANPKPYVPHWLYIDFHNGQWRGEFGYAEQD